MSQEQKVNPTDSPEQSQVATKTDGFDVSSAFESKEQPHHDNSIPKLSMRAPATGPAAAASAAPGSLRLPVTAGTTDATASTRPPSNSTFNGLPSGRDGSTMRRDLFWLSFAVYYVFVCFVVLLRIDRTKVHDAFAGGTTQASTLAQHQYVAIFFLTLAHFITALIFYYLVIRRDFSKRVSCCASLVGDSCLSKRSSVVLLVFTLQAVLLFADMILTYRWESEVNLSVSFQDSSMFLPILAVLFLLWRTWFAAGNEANFGLRDDERQIHGDEVILVIKFASWILIILFIVVLIGVRSVIPVNDDPNYSLQQTDWIPSVVWMSAEAIMGLFIFVVLDLNYLDHQTLSAWMVPVVWVYCTFVVGQMVYEWIRFPEQDSLILIAMGMCSPLLRLIVWFIYPYNALTIPRYLGLGKV